MKISEMIRKALEKKGFKNLKDASKVLGISPELLRVTINKGHIPKDKTLMQIANKLNLDKSVLILSAHQEKVPGGGQGFFPFAVPGQIQAGQAQVPAFGRTDQLPRKDPDRRRDHDAPKIQTGHRRGEDADRRLRRFHVRLQEEPPD